MKNISLKINNEKGSMIVIAMVILVLLTFIGIAVINTSKLDVDISANEKFHNRAFYDSDSGVFWAIATVSEADVKAVPEGGNIPVPAGRNNFQLTLLDNSITPCPVGSTCIEIQSEAAGERGEALIVAGIELPVPQNGALANSGEENTY